ncbi:MAG: ATP-binding cassette domain-containing protein [Erysipelotrichaceae bacterium]
MIKLVKLNKYFNRFKRNQIHVINNTSLEFGSVGLVALLGESGSGKTTLLNAIGGLDKVNRGSIFVDGKKLNSISGSRTDTLRNKYIGYIFQNYNLVEEMSVFENVEIALKMIGVRNKTERARRVNYVLKQVGLYRFRYRLVTALSGGQRQRVGIARALVKDPDIIIADEPTGNLDSANTIEIMNIIKTISKTKLVILVTHETKIAEFFATRIITLEDGKIVSDQDNTHEKELDYRIDQNIYLRDLPNHKRATFNDSEINIYSDSSANIQATIVVKNNNIYLQTNNGKNIETISNDSMIKLVDAHYSAIKEGDHQDEFDLKSVYQKKYKVRYKSVFTILGSLRFGFRKIGSYSKLKKVLMVGFVITSMIILFSLSRIMGAITHDDEQFVNNYSEYLTYKNSAISNDDLKAISEVDGVEYVLLGNSIVSFNLNLDRYSQVAYSYNYNKILGAIVKPELLDSSTIIAGRVAENPNEIVVDLLTFKKLKTEFNDPLTYSGYLNIEDYLGIEFNIGDYSHDYLSYRVVGVSDTKSPVIYLDSSQYNNLIYFDTLLNGVDKTIGGNEFGGFQPESSEAIEYLDAKLASNITIKKGRWPDNDNEVLINYDQSYTYELNKTYSDLTFAGSHLKVVGYYEAGADHYNPALKYVNSNMIFRRSLQQANSLTIYSPDKLTSSTALLEAGYQVIDNYQNDYDIFLTKNSEAINSQLVFMLVAIVIAILEVFLIMRASFLTRIKEIGVYRAIGMKKREMYKMFFGEITIITFTYGLFGILLMCFIINQLINSYFANDYVLTPWLVVLTLLIIYVINLVFGLLPVFLTLRKKPAAILARNDVQ